jgi:hypothetical protein
VLRLTESVTYPSGTPDVTDETAGTPTYGNITDEQEGPIIQQPCAERPKVVA